MTCESIVHRESSLCSNLDEERDIDEGHNYQSGTSDEHSSVSGGRDVGGNLIPATLRRCFRWGVLQRQLFACHWYARGTTPSKHSAQPCRPSTVLLCSRGSALERLKSLGIPPSLFVRRQLYQS